MLISSFLKFISKSISKLILLGLKEIDFSPSLKTISLFIVIILIGWSLISKSAESIASIKFLEDPSNIEHLMAALYGKGVDNLLVEIDAEEIPILDGSSKNFIEAIDSAELEISDQPIKIITIDKEVVYKEGDKSISFKPSKISLEIDFEINFKNELIKTQKNNINIYMDDLSDMYNSRTFCLYEDIEKLKNLNLAKGGSLDNAIVVKQNKILNKEKLRNEKEFVNHKILDCLGDLYLSGFKMVGKITSCQGGHNITNQGLRKLLSKNENFSIIELKEKNIPHSFLNKNILKSIA